ncbi:MAG: hypothetical protein JWN62_2710 [Acidimicrobiales bacterium]|nr:hypothetical protein [Acidimicrobiales bacterium]
MQPSSADPSASAASTPDTHRAQLTPRNIGITVVVALVLHFPALIRKSALNSDEATIATVARMLRHGAQLYTSAVDRKPPGAFTVYRLLEPIFGAWTLTAGRWLALTLTVVAMWILGFEARRRWPTVSPVAVAVLGIVAFSVLPAEDSRAVGFELLATLPAVAAFVLGARRRILPAAVMLGLAGLFKQPMLLGAAPLAVQCLSARSGVTVPRWSRRVLDLALAGVVTAGTVAAGLAPFGLRNAFSWFAGSGDKYLSGTHLSTVAIITLEQLGSFAGLTMGLLILAAVTWGRVWGRRPEGMWQRGERDRWISRDLAVWLVASLLATAIGLRFILHYFNQLLPPLVLLAAPAMTAATFSLQGPLSAARAKVARFGLVWMAGAAVFSMVTVLLPTVFHDLPKVDDVVRAIDAVTKPGDTIFVWGQAPEIYWMSDRDPATRYPHVGFITGVTPKRPGVPAYVLAQPGAAENLLADLEKNRPALIIDAAIASVRGGDRYPLATSPIAAFVAKGYCQIDSIDGIRLLSPCTP